MPEDKGSKLTKLKELAGGVPFSQGDGTKEMLLVQLDQKSVNGQRGTLPTFLPPAPEVTDGQVHCKFSPLSGTWNFPFMCKPNVSLASRVG